jgi:hypothetical protein
MRLLTTVFVLCILFAGCASTIEVRSNEPFNNDRVFNYTQLNTRIQRAPSTVVCVDGTTYETLGAFVGMDSTVFTDAESGLLRAIPTSRISRVQVKDYGAGTFTGGVVGFLSGLGAGTAWIVLTRGRSSHVEDDAAVAALGVLAGGTVAGLVIGSFVGSTREYELRAVESGNSR